MRANSKADEKRYRPEMQRGYVVGLSSPGRYGYANWSWYYGVDHGFGTTSGMLDYSVAVYPTRASAQGALDGYRARTGSCRGDIQTLAQARRLVAAAEERRAERERRKR